MYPVLYLFMVLHTGKTEHSAVLQMWHSLSWLLSFAETVFLLRSCHSNIPSLTPNPCPVPTESLFILHGLLRWNVCISSLSFNRDPLNGPPMNPLWIQHSLSNFAAFYALGTEVHCWEFADLSYNSVTLFPFHKSRGKRPEQICSLYLNLKGCLSTGQLVPYGEAMYVLAPFIKGNYFFNFFRELLLNTFSSPVVQKFLILSRKNSEK